jgi:hypothetical protein
MAQSILKRSVTSIGHLQALVTKALEFGMIEKSRHTDVAFTVQDLRHLRIPGSGSQATL